MSYGVHIVGITHIQMTRLERIIGEDISKCKQLPTQHFLIFIVDVNLPPAGTSPVPISLAQRQRVIDLETLPALVLALLV